MVGRRHGYSCDLSSANQSDPLSQAEPLLTYCQRRASRRLLSSRDVVVVEGSWYKRREIGWSEIEQQLLDRNQMLGSEGRRGHFEERELLADLVHNREMNLPSGVLDEALQRIVGVLSGHHRQSAQKAERRSYLVSKHDLYSSRSVSSRSKAFSCNGLDLDIVGVHDAFFDHCE